MLYVVIVSVLFVCLVVSLFLLGGGWAGMACCLAMDWVRMGWVLGRFLRGRPGWHGLRLTWSRAGSTSLSGLPSAWKDWRGNRGMAAWLARPRGPGGRMAGRLPACLPERSLHSGDVENRHEEHGQSPKHQGPDRLLPSTAGCLYGCPAAQLADCLPGFLAAWPPGCLAACRVMNV